MSTPNEVAARITHPAKHIVRITPDNGYSIALFSLPGASGRVEVVIASEDGTESWIVYLAPPKESETIRIKKIADSTEIIYAQR